jgi:hypothetical protein
MRITQGTFSYLANSRNTTIIKRWLLQFLEHGTVPTVVLAVAIAPTDSRIWQRHEFTHPTNREIEILFPASTTDRMTLPSKDYERTVPPTKALPVPPAPTIQQPATHFNPSRT